MKIRGKFITFVEIGRGKFTHFVQIGGILCLSSMLLGPRDHVSEGFLSGHVNTNLFYDCLTLE